MNIKVIWSVFFILVLCLTSCTKNSEDIFDTEFNKELNLKIPEGFDWSLTRSVDAVVEAVDDYNGKFNYNIRIYDEDPSINTQAKPIASGFASKDKPFAQKIIISQIAQKLYIKQTLNDPSGVEIDIASSTVDVNNISSVKLSRASISRANNKLGQTLPELCPDKLKDLSSFIKVETLSRSNLFLEDYYFSYDKSYLIESDCNIYINSKRFNFDMIYVAPGVKVNFILKNKDITFSIGSHSMLFNDGIITVSGGSETMTIYEGAEFLNNGSLTVSTLNFKGNGTIEPNAHLYKYSYIKCKVLSLDSGYITMDTGSYINCDVLTRTQGQDGVISIASIDKESPVNIDGYDYAALIVVNDKITNSSGIYVSGNSENSKLLIQCKEGARDGLDKNPDSQFVEFFDDASELIYINATSTNPGFGYKQTKLGTVTYCMEDQYPAMGDFDLNDVVVKISPTLLLKSDNSSAKVNISCKIVAVGATKVIAGYISINNAETLLFGNAHKEMGVNNGVFVNTEKGTKKVAPVTIEKNGIACNVDFNFDDLKFFIRVDDHDIYAADQGGINASSQIIGGVRIPDENFKFSIERKKITETYNENGFKISDWISSKATKSKDWYKHPSAGNYFDE